MSELSRFFNLYVSNNQLYRVLLSKASSKQIHFLFLIFMTETISRTDEGQPRPKHIINKTSTILPIR